MRATAESSLIIALDDFGGFCIRIAQYDNARINAIYLFDCITIR